MKLTLTQRQRAFVRAQEFEVLYGGAAGGGKSYGQLCDALIYALRYPGSKQLLLRRTYGELEKTLVRQALELYPREIFKFEASRHCGRFRNGSLLDFGSLDARTTCTNTSRPSMISFDSTSLPTSPRTCTAICSRGCAARTGFPKQ